MEFVEVDANFLWSLMVFSCSTKTVQWTSVDFRHYYVRMQDSIWGHTWGVEGDGCGGVHTLLMVLEGLFALY